MKQNKSHGYFRIWKDRVTEATAIHTYGLVLILSYPRETGTRFPSVFEPPIISHATKLDKLRKSRPSSMVGFVREIVRKSSLTGTFKLRTEQPTVLVASDNEHGSVGSVQANTEIYGNIGK